MKPSAVRSGLRSHTVVGSAGHDVASPADAAERAVGVHAASVHTRELLSGAVLTLVHICNTEPGSEPTVAAFNPEFRT